MWKQYSRSSLEIKVFGASCYSAGQFMLTCRGHSSRACQAKIEVLSRHKHCEAKSIAHPVTAHGNAVMPL